LFQTEESKKEFIVLIEYYLDTGESISSLAQYYTDWLNDIIEEQFFFRETGHYRYSVAADVDELFYENQFYMKTYMIGLSLSTYLMGSHAQYVTFFEKALQAFPKGKRFLEVGPGHGVYFIKAIQQTDYKQYLGIDISEKAVELCYEMVKRRLSETVLDKIAVEKKDFFALDEKDTFDAVVIGEVLEHVEHPEAFLHKVYDITTDKSFIYLTTVVNCPQKDHIFLFHSVDEIEKLYHENGFEIIDSLYIPTNGYSMEKAIKKKAAINTAHVLKKIIL
ncbi:MAG: class I SAM-dependent methyltransferase, partial [Lachnospiraceae bacterium]|nr:class I SAM-dependent methyltransferase [Lachnospiraceae bacterium]